MRLRGAGIDGAAGVNGGGRTSRINSALGISGVSGINGILGISGVPGINGILGISRVPGIGGVSGISRIDDTDRISRTNRMARINGADGTGWAKRTTADRYRRPATRSRP